MFLKSLKSYELFRRQRPCFRNTSARVRTDALILLSLFYDDDSFQFGLLRRKLWQPNAPSESRGGAKINEARVEILQEKPDPAPGFRNSAAQPPHPDDKRPEKADLAKWKCEMKEEHVNETKEEINSIKRQIFGVHRRGVGAARAPAPHSTSCPRCHRSRQSGCSSGGGGRSFTSWGRGKIQRSVRSG